MTRFWFVRHGPTHAKAFAGWRDIPADLSDTAAIARLNALLPAGVPVISSDLIRASATADALCRHRPRLPDDPDLREFHFGDWDGLGFAEVAERWPELSRSYWEEPGHIAPPGGESWVAAAARIGAAVDRLARHPEIIVVAHLGVILTQYQRAAGIDPRAALAQPIDTLSVTCLTLAPPAVHCVNHRS
ncbi:MAG: histidine phosphatase family protein [Tabrizicola sp.]